MERLRCLQAILTSSVLLLWALSAALPTQTNVDTEEPSVIRSPALNTDPQDGFGWSAVFHQREVVVAGDEQNVLLNKIRIVIGAPKGTFPLAEDLLLRAENRSGLVYSCSVRGMCEGVRGNESVYLPPDNNDANIINGAADLGANDETTNFYPSAISEGRLFDQAPNFVNLGTNSVFEQKSGQLMGSSLYSSGENILACAPLWNTLSAEPRGLCFIGDRQLSNFKTLFPCRFLPGVRCLAGFSADIVNNHVALGAPGHTMFTGAIATTAINTTTAIDTPEFPEFAFDEFSFPPSSVTSFHSGWQITHGYISMNDREQPAPNVLASTPRHNGRGNYTGQVAVIASDQLPFLPLTNILSTVEGRQHAEFFGYSIATCDLTGDGYDELVVGAPMYTALSPLVVPERGRVYVFFNSGGSLNQDPVILEGLSAYGRFGFAVANVGDLDADGHEDFAVGAPYEKSSPSSANSGAVYVYYGRNTAIEFENQTAQRILADNIVDSVNTLATLSTFGFSLNGNMDVDGNGHQDFLASAPDEQAVIVLRTIPFVNVTVDIADVDTVNIDENPSFEVIIAATYTSTTVRDSLAVRFNLMEDVPVGMSNRLFFADRNTFAVGTFQFTGPNVTIMVPIRVFAIVDISDLSPYQLKLDLIDFERSVPPVSGNQEFSDLSLFPRLRLLGNSNVSVPTIDTCGDLGCTSDVVLRPLIPSTRELVAGQASSVLFNVSYTNIGPEDGRSLMLAIYNVPSKIFSALELITIQTNGPPSSCSFEFNTAPFTNVTCDLTERLRSNEDRIAELTFFLASTLVGNEEPFDLSIEILLDLSDMNNDTNVANNIRTIQFTVTSQSDINIALMRFSQSVYEYASEVPGPSDVRSGASVLGDDALLQIDVGNSGPSSIQSARIVIMFPSRNAAITTGNYFLYPATLTVIREGSTGVSVNCTDDALDPQSMESEPVLRLGRRRRSAYPAFTTSRRVRRLAAMKRASPGELEEDLSRHKRQTSDITLDCGVADCDIITCDIRNLSTSGVGFLLRSVLDERFYSTGANSRVFTVIATSVVSVTSSFQIADDNTADNMESAEAMIRPEAVGGGPDNLVHYIVWPIIGGILILVVLVILLYCVGFFRRKKKPGEDEEVEGDFSAPPGTEAVKPAAEPQTKEEATTV